MFYRYLIEACGINEQKEEAAKIFQEIKRDLEPSVDTINAYFQACGRASINRKRSIDIQEEQEHNKKLEDKLIKIIDKAVVELSTKCKNIECDRYFREEEIISAWSKSFDTYFITCPKCGKDIIPTIDVQTSINKTKSYYFLFPPLFKKELSNLVENKDIEIFFTVTLVYN
jgi:hypothetical protein